MHFYKHPNDTLPTQFRVDYHKSIERQGVHCLAFTNIFLERNGCNLGAVDFWSNIGKTKMQLTTIALQFSIIC